MAHLTRERWPNGWIPSDDDLNGRKDGLLRMDNCYLDENGVVSLVPGTQIINGPFPGIVHTIYSRVFGSQQQYFLGLSNGAIYSGGGHEIIGAGHPSSASFSTAFGFVFMATGTKKGRWDGTRLYELGLSKSGIVNAVNATGPVVTVLPSWAGAIADTGTIETPGDNVEVLAEENLGAVRVARGADLTAFDDGGFGTDEDRFHFPIRIENTDKLVSVRVAILLEFAEGASDYYFFEWNNNSIPSPFTQGLNAWTSLECKRSEFERVGSNTDLDWKSVAGIRVEVRFTENLHFLATPMYFFGSSKGPLNGSYEYMQVNVRNTGTYQVKSEAGEPSQIVFPINGRVEITPSAASESDVNEIWIFRRSADPSKDVTDIGAPRKLEQWYRVKILESATQFEDELSDELALREGTTHDERNLSILDFQDEIFGLTDYVFGRICYLTVDQIIISAFNDPESYNPFHTVKLSGTNLEKNLWIAKVGEGRLLIGTTKDIYELTGTFRDLPDGTLDINIIGLGVEYAPITVDFAVDRGAVYYFASDGWRRISGANSELLLGDLDLLFKGKNRFGIPPVAIYPNAQARYAVTIYKDQLWAVLNFQDGSRHVVIYDFVRKYWHLRYLEAISLHVTEAGELVGGFGGASGNYLRKLDTGTSFDSNMPVTNVVIQTGYDNDSLPRNRKDTFSLRIKFVNSGTVEVYIGKDREGFTKLGDFASGEYVLKLDDYTLGKAYAVQIIGRNLTEFKWYGFSIEYDPRPEQVSYLRIPNSNLGTLARKRFTSYPFVVDTLGGDVTFTPYIDNSAKAPSTINNAVKLTHSHFFTEETVGVDIGGILEAPENQPFEFYGPNLEDAISEKLPAPTCFLVIPQDDYGNPNRKRHSSYKFKINTRGQLVRFTPKIDGVTYAPLDFSTSEKRTVEYFFIVDTIGIDIGGTLQSLTSDPCVPFEYYGTIVPQHIEVLPPRLKQFYAPETNFGIAAKKRVRTLPMQINTNGFDVTFTPRIDGVVVTASTLNTARRQTTFHYFNTDIFAIDFAGEFLGNDPFEFYGFEKPEEVEIIPVGKLFDQLGPIEIPRVGKLLAVRLRVISGVSTIPLRIFTEDENVYEVNFPTVIVNRDVVTEIVQFPKTVTGTIFRFELGPVAFPIHRYSMDVRFNASGMDKKWIKIK